MEKKQDEKIKNKLLESGRRAHVLGDNYFLAGIYYFRNYVSTNYPLERTLELFDIPLYKI